MANILMHQQRGNFAFSHWCDHELLKAGVMSVGGIGEGMMVANLSVDHDLSPGHTQRTQFHHRRWSGLRLVQLQEKLFAMRHDV